jgi:hypothetical protein
VEAPEANVTSKLFSTTFEQLVVREKAMAVSEEAKMATRN